MKTLGFLCLVGLFTLAKPTEAACSGEAIINNQGDLDKLGSCQTFSGSIKIDNTGATELRLPGVELLQGDLVVSNNNGLQKLYLPSLQGVNGGLILNNNKLLAVLDMPKLQACNNFDIMVHPALKAIKFPAKLSQLQRLNVADTTATAIEGLTAAQPREIEIKHNIYLKQLELGNLITVERIKIFANSPALTVDVSKLEEIVSGEFRNIAGIALFRLRKVNGDISFIANTFPNLDLPAINDIIGTLNIADNTNLNNLTMHKLEHLGGALAIGGNTRLQSIRSFPELQGIEGSVDIYGEFDEVFFPVLNDVRGSFNIQSSSNNFNCEPMDALKNGVIKGNTYLCVGSVTTPRPAGLSGGGGGSGGRAGGVGSRKTKMLNSANHLVSPTFGGIVVAFGILTAIHL